MESEEIKEEPITFDEEEEDIERKVFPDDEENVFKILIATDLHLGYEQTTKRLQEDDSFRTFEEILQKAKKLDVDMLLLGGDLFHESKPPSIVINRCISLLREYCLGTKDIKIKFTTDPKVVFSHCQHKTVNYEDENLNVSIPVFSIHGNHDDPSYGTIGLMDLLSSTGLVNYFGKWSDVKQVTIPPIILEKGKSKVALYGISYMNDQRLSRLIKNGKFHLLTPKKKDEDKDEEDKDQIFNIFVLHQNRARHSKNAFIPEDSLPDFLDLIVWGHEHECRIEPERVANKPYSISQPGSSVATSLAKGESEEKFVGLLKVCKGEYKLEKLKLETVRPFVFQDMILKDFEDEIVVKGKREKSEVVEEFVDHYIENVLIAEAAKQFTGDANQPQTPLIRLRIFHTEDEDIFDTLGLSQKYQDIVANPNDMIVFRKCSSSLKKLDIEEDIGDLDDIAEIFHFDDAEKDWNSTIEGGMKEFFSQENHVDKLTVLSLVGLNSALNRFVNLHDSTAIVDLTRKQIEKTVNRLMEKNIDSEEDIITEIKHYRNERLAKQKEEEEEVNNYLNIRKTQPRDNSPELMDQDNGDNESEEEFPTSTRGRGRGRAKKANATRGTAKATTRGSRARGRAARNQSILDL